MTNRRDPCRTCRQASKRGPAAVSTRSPARGTARRGPEPGSARLPGDTLRSCPSPLRRRAGRARTLARATPGPVPRGPRPGRRSAETPASSHRQPSRRPDPRPLRSRCASTPRARSNRPRAAPVPPVVPSGPIDRGARGFRPRATVAAGAVARRPVRTAGRGRPRPSGVVPDARAVGRRRVGARPRSPRPTSTGSSRRRSASAPAGRREVRAPHRERRGSVSTRPADRASGPATRPRSPRCGGCRREPALGPHGRSCPGAPREPCR